MKTKKHTAKTPSKAKAKTKVNINTFKGVSRGVSKKPSKSSSKTTGKLNPSLKQKTSKTKLKDPTKRFDPPKLNSEFLMHLKNEGIKLPENLNSTRTRWLQMAQILMLSQSQRENRTHKENVGSSKETKDLRDTLKMEALKASKEWSQRNRRKAKLGILPKLEEKILKSITTKTNTLCEMNKEASVLSSESETKLDSTETKSQGVSDLNRVGTPQAKPGWRQSWLGQILTSLGLLSPQEEKPKNPENPWGYSILQ